MNSNKIYAKVAKVIDEYSEDVDIEVYTEPTYSKYGDLITQTTSDYTAVPALFNRYGRESEYQPEGIFNNGDTSIFFKGDQAGLVVGSVVVRANGERWKITKVDRNILNSRNMVQEVGAQLE